MKLKSIKFLGCRLDQVDLTQADLTGGSFGHSDLSRGIFSNTILEKADLETAVNFSIDPEYNRIRKTRFSKDNITGLLDKYDLRIT